MGSVNLDNTGSGADVTLSSDGTSLLLDGTAIGGGGGGADLYAAETTGSTNPTASGTLSLAIGSAASSTGLRSLAIGRAATAAAQDSVAIGTDANAGSATGSVAIKGNISGSSSVPSVAILGSTTQPASVVIGSGCYVQAHSAVAIGYDADVNLGGTGGISLGDRARISGTNAVALVNSRASGASSLAAAITNNTTSYGASGANSVAMGYLAKANNSYATVSGGASNVASGYHSTVIGGSSNLADNIGSTVLGGRYGTTRGIRGAAVFGGYGNQITATQGTSQSGLYILAEQTTDATATALKTDNQSSSSTANQIVLPNGGAYAFTGTIVGREAASSGTECAAWKVEGLIRREANAGSTVLVNSSTTVLNNAPNWGMALSADTTNGALAITVTGAAKTIRWVATIQTTELTFA